MFAPAATKNQNFHIRRKFRLGECEKAVKLVRNRSGGVIPNARVFTSGRKDLPRAHNPDGR
jgi:hypothetical protein